MVQAIIENTYAIFIALITGGVVKTLVDNWNNRRKNQLSNTGTESDRLINEVNRLRADVNELRTDVSILRADLDGKVEEISALRERWYHIRLVVTSLVTYIQHQNVLSGDAELLRLVQEALELTTTRD